MHAVLEHCPPPPVAVLHTARQSLMGGISSRLPAQKRLLYEKVIDSVIRGDSSSSWRQVKFPVCTSASEQRMLLLTWQQRLRLQALAIVRRCFSSRPRQEV